MPDPKELFAAGRMLARMKAKYMKAIILGFAPIEAPGLGTIGVTEHGVLMLDWDFIAELQRTSPSGTQAAEEVAGLLVHEALHVLLKHGKRSRLARRDVEISGKTDDMSINDMVWDMGFRLPGGGSRVTPDHPLHGEYAEEYGWPKHLTADEYYERFTKQLQRQPQAGSGGAGQGNAGAGGKGTPQDPNDEQGEGGSGGDDDHAHPGRGPCKGPKQPQAGPKKPQAGGGWCGSCAGRPMPNEPSASHPASRSEAELQRIARQVAQAVREEAALGRGTVPAGLMRWADELLAPAEVPWEKELAQLTRNALAWRPNAVDHKYDAPSRRQAGIGYGPGKPMLPRFRMPVPNVTVIIDTSGSMGTQELTLAGREVNGILKAVGANITFVTCDATVHGITKVKSLKEALSALKGGGGTDMRPAVAAVVKQRPRPEVVVCITDLAIGHPGDEPRGMKFVWVGVGAHQGPAPVWGKTIRVKKGGNAPEVHDTFYTMRRSA